MLPTYSFSSPAAYCCCMDSLLYTVLSSLQHIHMLACVTSTHRYLTNYQYCYLVSNVLPLHWYHVQKEKGKNRQEKKNPNLFAFLVPHTTTLHHVTSAFLFQPPGDSFPLSMCMCIVFAMPYFGRADCLFLVIDEAVLQCQQHWSQH